MKQTDLKHLQNRPSKRNQVRNPSIKGLLTTYEPFNVKGLPVFLVESSEST